MAFTVAQVLKAAWVLSGRTQREVGIRAVVRESRLARILAGRTPATSDEIDRILRACGVRVPLTSPAVLSSSLNQVLFAVLLEEQARNVGPPSGVILLPRLNIDTLAMTFNVVSESAFLGLIEDNGLIRGQGRSSYTDSWRHLGVFVQHRAKKSAKATKRRAGQHPPSRTSLIEFSPSDVLRHARRGGRPGSFVRRVLANAKKGSIRLSRIDVAVDVDVSLHDIQALGSPRCKMGAFWGQQGVETLLSGKRQSGRHIRIYDRVQHGRDKGKPLSVSGGPLTRIEAQLRNPKIGLQDLTELSNPFRELRLFEVPRPSATATFEERMLLVYARAFGVPALRTFLAPDQFKRAVDLLAIGPAPREFPHPAVVFDNNWRSVAAQVQRLLFGSSSGRVATRAADA